MGLIGRRGGGELGCARKWEGEEMGRSTVLARKRYLVPMRAEEEDDGAEEEDDDEAE